ncbi:dTDP-glucose pyrophosphorylase [Klebsiella sp. RHBSTW-00484]|uniref:dTDP-glucose pyrophosphorylase n=1 Tax=unclassified Klebsiella TaxID=2608929 RepID=UPI0015E580E9|nr:MULTISPECIES: dTDP-glucose pyrophosphorylase [unclassified Klebsiella]MBA7845760.1 dTDP-glucose pyrophosphorylase [Klebsiella sp. RHBSTW-00465]QLO38300.1 dTDP-glucose pyrophosphorylase [Klebsiella sp. RHBSTW-00484]QLT77820.1 dTDP-glucose pyrophosphorylase [Klebsiella sp. RHBSTW-00464]
MSELPRLITTLAMPPIDEVTVPFHGLNFLRPELMLDFITISDAQLLAVTSVALLYSSVGVLQHVELRKLPIEVSGRVVYPISTLKLPAMRAKLIINAQSKRLKFLESLLSNTPNENIHGMQILGLALEFTVAKSA